MTRRDTPSRRRFVKATGAAAAFTILPRYALGGAGQTPPSERLNVGVIGAGGRGLQNTKAIMNEADARVIAVCDVNEWADYSNFYYGGVAGRGPTVKAVEEHYKDDPSFKGCAAYVDFREMLEKETDLDAVIISTPDHQHAVNALAAIDLGLHVYCEKPLARTIYEVRKITEAAREKGVITQMGNQGHSQSSIYDAVEWLQAGAIGDVTEIHAWTLQPIHMGKLAGRPEARPSVPKGLDWDLWLGPAEKRPYHPYYTPFDWRAWWDFGGGALSDLGVHHLDLPFWALDLGYPTRVEARATELNDHSTPSAALVFFDFPARGDKPPVKATWYTGLMPPRPEEMTPGYDFIGQRHGSYLVGTEGKLMTEGWGRSPRFIPISKTRDYARPPKTMERVKGHHREWLDAIKENRPANSNFDYGGFLTEVVLSGNVAMRTNKKLDWDGKGMRATNCPEADEFIRPQYHNGWTI